MRESLSEKNIPQSMNPEHPRNSTFCLIVMAVSDAVVRNFMMLYLTAIAAIKGYGQLTGRSYGGASVLIISTAAVGVLLLGALTWDVCRKAATYAVVTRVGDEVEHEMCRGGICWHGVAVKSPASQLRLRLPQRQQVNGQ
ncbi:hypothetical protein L1987_79071 [Smallanthus sonchifolius]|uniref:Uncharacterized protein n=1 Tax=Smallanthus sonchifolius TaxID=185202 RepID=A0ACB8ZE45_9ASTR|nr:hypothetical protein L1987_79071 [Smallanthus sonchifolius]